MEKYRGNKLNEAEAHKMPVYLLWEKMLNEVIPDLVRSVGAP
jgi:hypothetical protein